MSSGLNKDRLIWLGLGIGVAAFCTGAASNPAALKPLWSAASWTSLAILSVAAVTAAIVQGVTRRASTFGLIFGSVVVVAAFGVGAFATVALILASAFALGARLLHWMQDDAPDAAPSG